MYDENLQSHYDKRGTFNHGEGMMFGLKEKYQGEPFNFAAWLRRERAIIRQERRLFMFAIMDCLNRESHSAMMKRLNGDLL